MTAARQIAARHFGKDAVAVLASKGISIIGTQALPDASGSFLNSETGYVVNDKGCGRVLTYDQVRKALR